MFQDSTLAMLGVGLFLGVSLIVCCLFVLAIKGKTRSIAKLLLSVFAALLVVGSLTVMTLTVTQAYANYQLEGACIKQKIQAGVPRKHIYVQQGKCMVIRNGGDNG